MTTLGDAVQASGSLRNRVGTLLEFWWFEALLSTRLPVSLKTFKALAILLTAVGAATAFVLTLVVLTLLRSSLADDPKYSGGLVLLAFIISIWSLCSAWIRETLTQRRFSVSRSANAPLYRALDIRASDVLLVYRGIPIVGSGCRTLLLLLPTLIYAHQAQPVPLEMWAAALLLVLLSGTAAFAKAVWNSIRPDARAGDSIGAACGALALALSVGWGTGHLVQLWAGSKPGVSIPASSMFAVVLAAAASLGILAAILGIRRDMRWLRNNSFPVVSASRTHRTAKAPAGGRRLRSAGLMAYASATVRNGAGTWQYGAASRVLLVTGAILAFVAGIRFSEFRPLQMLHMDMPMEIPVQSKLLGFYLVVVVAVSLVDLVLSVAGPTQMAPHLRTAWESGANVRSLALGQAMVSILPSAAAGVAAGLSMACLGLSHAAICLPLGICVGGGAIIADAAAISPKSADGSGTMPALNTLISLLFAVPLLIAVVKLDSWLLFATAALYTAAIFIGANLCIRNRILSHPSSSRASVQATQSPPSSRTSA